MDQEPRAGGSPSLSSGALGSGHDPAPSGARSPAGASCSSTGWLASIPSCGASVSGTRPRRSWDTAFPNRSSGESGSSADRGGAGRRARTGAAPDLTFRSMAIGGRGATAVAIEGAAASATAGAAGYSISSPRTEESALRNAEKKATDMPAENGTPRGRNDDSPTDGGTPCRSSNIHSAGTSASSLDLSDPPAVTAARGGGMGSSEDELADTDEGVMARLTEFTEIARRTAAQNEELSRELAAEKRRVAQTARKLEQSNMTSMELTESLALAQDTVTRLREHEMAWAERTASEMSLRSEMCALKDDFNRVSGDYSAIKKRCDSLQQENAELSQRLTAIAEEKRQVESKARRLLRSDRYRGY